MTAPAPAADEAARILVVDDEEAIVQLLTTVLRYEGFEVESAADGRAALRAAERFRPDPIMLDVMLPDLDGFEVYRRIAAGAHPIPVLFLTAKDEAADRVRGSDAGRRRLRGQTVQPGGGGGPGAGRSCAARKPGRRPPRRSATTT
jgi:two-component system, OmpR family, response regulator